MSHELRTPLNAIIGFSEIMEQQLFGALGSQKYVEYCNGIHRSGDYLLGILSDILDMSRLDAGVFELEARELDLSAAARETLERMRPEADKKNIELIADLSGQFRCRGDGEAVEKAMSAILSNSVKFTDAGGRVRVRARRHGEFIDVYVEDSGCGIEKDALHRLGRPFVQPFTVMDDGMKGAGLGLAIARSLMELHGGALRIRSRVGAGSVVMLRLPASAVAQKSRPSDERGRSAEAAAARLLGRQSFPRSARAAGMDTTTRSPGSLSSMRSAP